MYFHSNTMNFTEFIAIAAALVVVDFVAFLTLFPGCSRFSLLTFGTAFSHRMPYVYVCEHVFLIFL